ncbi:MAG: hypothetical protein HY928_02225 [Elusimicrobia bacterium]|nr:hypothetical protein [Elusimicrobiota bacterium]
MLSLLAALALTVRAAEAPNLESWARRDVGGFLGWLPAAVSALGSDRPTGPLDLPLAPPMPLPIAGASPLAAWMERAAASTTQRIAGSIADLGRAGPAAEPVELGGSDGIPGLGLPPGAQAEPFALPVIPEPAPRQIETRPLSQDALPAPAGSGLWLMGRGRRAAARAKPSMRGTGFRTGDIRPSPIAPTDVSSGLR